MSEKTFKRSARRLLDRLGVPCTLKPYSGAADITDCKVHISRDIEVVSPGQSERSERRSEAEMLVEDVGNLKKRDLITVGADVWRVESKVANDGYTVRVVVSEQ